MITVFINRMKNRAALAQLFGLALLLMAGPSMAAVTSASGHATASMLMANKNNTFTINWQVQTTTDRFSVRAEVANAPILTILAGSITPAAATYSETFQISGAQVQSWLDAGLMAVVIRRHFTEVGARFGTGVNADVTLRLTTSGLRATRELNLFEIQRMRLSFSNQTNLIVVEPGEELLANLDVNYSGSGVLEGAWQIAEPGSTEGLVMYRTLRLVKQTLSAAQQVSIQSPVLPTQRPGKYLLRFCLIDRKETQAGGNDFNCPDTDRLVEAAYQVLAKPRFSMVEIEVAPLRGNLDQKTELSWTPVEGAVVYQLQVFQKLGQQAPVFISGMLLPQTPNKTTFSKLVNEKLAEGKTYQWRINALNPHGQIIGQSPLTNFIYSAGQ